MELQPRALTQEKADDVAWNLIGIRVAENTGPDRSKYGLNVKGGLIITDISKDSYLGQKGVRPGHILFQINQTEINTIDAFRKIIIQISGSESAFIFIYAQGDKYRIIVPLR